uniref:Arabinogalactan peptide 13-like n=1 Tax=Rhizophora mucronata TaxID=61149 RepID=A0A2P2JS69_RHIMU
MEALKLRLFLATVIALVVASAVQNAAAAEAPAPSPTSDANVFVPTVLASLASLAFGVLF